MPGYPVALVDPAEVAKGEQMVAESINEAAIGDLTGSGHDDIVVASNEVYGAGKVGEEVNFSGITSGAAGSTARLYAIDGATGKIMPGWPVKLPGIIQNVLPLVGPGQDAEIAKIFWGYLHRSGCYVTLCGIAPHDRSASLGRDDRVNRCARKVQGLSAHPPTLPTRAAR